MIKVLLFLFLLIPTLCFGGITFDGVDDYVQVTDWISSNQAAFSCYARCNFTSSDTDDFIAYYRTSGAPGTGFSFQRDDVGAVSGRTDCFRVGVAGATTLYTVEGATNSAVSGTWYDVIWVFSSAADTLRLYINGVEDFYSGDTSGAGDMVAQTTNCFIGATSATAANTMMNGQITEIAFWDVALTVAEVALLSNSKIKGIPLQIRPANLVLYLPMDDQTADTSADGDTVYDKSGNARNGTGVDGANNTGLTWSGESVLSYPAQIGRFQ
jgi:hypothetical protein